MGTVTLTPLGYGSYLSTDTTKWQSSANVMHTGVDGQYSDGHYYNYISALTFTTGTAGAKGITVTLKTGGGGSQNNQCPGNVVAYLSKTFTSWKQAWNLYGSATALTSSATSGNSWVKGEQNYTFTTSAVLDPSETYYVFIRASGTWTGGDKPSSTRHTNWSVAGGSADITVTDDTRTLSLSGDEGISATSGAGTKSLNSVANIDATVRSGYTWKKWLEGTTSFSSTKNTTVTMDKNRTLNATTDVITYSISYSLVGGSLPSGKTNPSTYNVTTAAFTLNNPTKLGYSFTGWTGSNGSTKQTSVTISKGTTGDKSYTANWEPNTYTVTYNGNGATSGSTTASTHTYDAAKNLTANGFVRKYTVTYNHNYTGSTNTTRDATYTFSKWNTNAAGTGTSYNNQASVTNLATSGNFNLYAQWTSASVNYTPTRTGYRFGGWYTTSACTTSVTHPYTPIDSTKTFYAKWDANTYTVSYNGNGHTGGSTVSSSHTYDVSKSLTSNGFTKTGYEFAGWATSSTGAVVYSNGQSVTNLTSTHGGTVTLYAKWTPITYSIAYNKNNGSGSMSNSTHTYDKAKALTANTYTRSGYTFDGWNTNSSGTGTSYADKASVKNLSSTKNATVTLYAQWEPNTGTAYKVQHWQQKVGAGTTQNTTNFELVTTDSKTGTTGNTTTASAKSYAGFTVQSFDQRTISGDGNTIVNIYYHRNSYTLSANKGAGISSITVPTGSHQFGEKIDITASVSSGYTWSNWSYSGTAVTLPATTSGSITMPAGDVTLTANATANTNTQYTVKHWKQNLNATGTTQNATNYTEDTTASEIKTGTTAALTQATAKRYSGFTASPITQKTIAGGGSTVVNVYYVRNSYTVTLSRGTGVKSVTGNGTYKYEQEVTVTASMDTGYTWSRWSGSKSSTSMSFTFSMPAEDVTLTANSTANGYTVTYVGQNGKQSVNAPRPGSTSNIIDEATYNAMYNIREESTAFTRTGYKFLGWSQVAGSKDISTWEPGTTVKWTLDDDLILYAIWKSKGVLYVDNGSEFIPYTIWIDSGSTTGGPNNDGWYQYTAWLDTGDESQGTNGWVQLGSIPD